MRFFLRVSCLILALGATVGMAQTPATSTPANQGGFWVSAGYGIPNSFVIGTGIHDIFAPNISLDVQVAILDRAGVRFDIMPMYYADALLDLPPLTSLYGALGPSFIINTDVDFGISAKVGMEYRLKAIDFEPMAAFIEVQPRVHLTPTTQLTFNAALGLRVHF